MEDNNSPKAPTLCTAGCGFYGNELFNNMCSQCYKASQQKKNSATNTTSTTAASTITSSNTNTTSKTTTNTTSSPSTSSTAPIIVTPSSTKALDEKQQQQSEEKVESAVSSPMSISTPSSEITLNPRKHARTPSPEPSASTLRSSAPPPSISSPSSSVDVAVDSPSSERPIQTNKGRCFKCRVKIPLAKQAANKCRCSYVFCDSHRYPDRHDCEVDHAKLDRDILAKNNPKLHERPKGGRSFQRIDSL